MGHIQNIAAIIFAFCAGGGDIAFVAVGAVDGDLGYPGLLGGRQIHFGQGHVLHPLGHSPPGPVVDKAYAVAAVVGSDVFVIHRDDAAHLREQLPFPVLQGVIAGVPGNQVIG